MKKLPGVDAHVIQQIKMKRISLGCSQQQLARSLGVTGSYISRVERMRWADRYSLSRINEIAKILNCSIHDLLPENTV